MEGIRCMQGIITIKGDGKRGQTSIVENMHRNAF